MLKEINQFSTQRIKNIVKKMPTCQITDLNVNFIQKLQENSRPGKVPGRGSIPVREGTKPSRAFKAVSGMFRQDVAAVSSLGSDIKPHSVTSVDTVIARAQAAIHDITQKEPTSVAAKPNPMINENAVNAAENTPELTSGTDNNVPSMASVQNVVPGVTSVPNVAPGVTSVSNMVPGMASVPSVGGNTPSGGPEKRDHLPPGIVCGDGYQLRCSCVRQ